MSTGTGKYFTYEFGLSIDPVNQIPFGNEYLAALGRFAHDIHVFNDKAEVLRRADSFDQGHALEHDTSEAAKVRTTYWLSRAILGYAWRRVTEWMALEPDWTVRGLDGEPADWDNWKTVQNGTLPRRDDTAFFEQTVYDLMALLCGPRTQVAGRDAKPGDGLCVGNWMRRLNRRINYQSYDQALNIGGLHVPNIAVDSWAPHTLLYLFAGLSSERSDQWGLLMEEYGKALDYYDAT